MSIKGGVKLKATLTRMAKSLQNASSVEVGWNKTAVYPMADGGLPVAYVAYVNEYGGTFTVPEHEVRVYRAVDKDGDFLRQGRFVKPRQSNFETVHVIKAHDVTVPARPFFRGMIAKEKPFWGSDMNHALKETGYDAKRALGLMGEEITARLQEEIIEFKSPPNAPSTIARKGFDDPLIEHGVMLQTANYTVK